MFFISCVLRLLKTIFPFPLVNTELMWLIHHSYSRWARVVKTHFHNCIYLILLYFHNIKDSIYFHILTSCPIPYQLVWRYSFRACGSKEEELFKPILKMDCLELLLVLLFYSFLILYCWLLLLLSLNHFCPSSHV